MLAGKYKFSNIVLVASGLIDAALTFAIFFLFCYFALPPFLAKAVESHPNLCIFALFILYRLVSLLCFGKTSGMKLFNVVLLNSEEDKLSLNEKLLASIFILFKGVGYYKK